VFSFAEESLEGTTKTNNGNSEDSSGPGIDTPAETQPSRRATFRIQLPNSYFKKRTNSLAFCILVYRAATPKRQQATTI
jgi:hypothetical protein